jgi:hypothetical protein
MVPPATALTQNKAICAAARHTAAGSAQSAARARLTVAPQLPRAASSSVCRSLPTAFLQASDQKEREDMIRQGGSFKEALIRKWAQCCSFVAAAAVFEKRARWCVRRQWLPLLQNVPDDTLDSIFAFFEGRPDAADARLWLDVFVDSQHASDEGQQTSLGDLCVNTVSF